MQLQLSQADLYINVDNKVLILLRFFFDDSLKKHNFVQNFKYDVLKVKSKMLVLCFHAGA